ncbi:MAG TPA: endonuclease [Panacibacter sp.]|nr:endonuclease [Panacibacter sp.]
MRKFLPFIFFYFLSTTLNAQIPSGYYDAATGKSCAALKSALKKIITTGHKPQSYDQLYIQYKKSDIKPRETGSGSVTVIWDIYSDVPNGKDPYNFDPSNDQCGNYTAEGDCFNREHTVPQSWFNSEATPGSDYMQIFPTDGYVNGKRGNYLYGEVANSTYTSRNGSKEGSSAVAGITGTVFEPVDTYKGDVARAFFYFVSRYQDNIPAWSSNTDAFSHDTFPSINIFYLNMMLKWAAEDPVSQKEIDRNNAGYLYQNNRNPFIDHPEYAGLVWNYACPGLGTLPVDIVYFTGKLAGNIIALNWKTTNAVNLQKFEIEKSFNGTSYTKTGELTAKATTQYTYSDNVSNQTGRRIFYRLKKTDKDGSFTYSEVFTIYVPLNQVFAISPNPANNFITVQLKETNVYAAQILICNLAGKTIITHACTTGSGPVNIPTTRLSNGAYFVKMLVNNQQFVQKLIVTR